MHAHQQNELQVKLATALGLDPAVTTQVSVTVAGGQHATVEWTGKRRLTDEELTDVVLAIQDTQS